VLQIAKNNYYEISYDEKKNRIFYKVIGYWPCCNIVPNYLDDIGEVLNYVKPCFTMIVDASFVEPHPPEVEVIRKKAQSMAVQNGLLCAAEIVSSSFVSNLQFDEMTKSTNFRKNRFTNLEDAEEFLDQEVLKLCVPC
jgi:hypothetical protein